MAFAVLCCVVLPTYLPTYTLTDDDLEAVPQRVCALIHEYHTYTNTTALLLSKPRFLAAIPT